MLNAMFKHFIHLKCRIYVFEEKTSRYACSIGGDNLHRERSKLEVMKTDLKCSVEVFHILKVQKLWV